MRRRRNATTKAEDNDRARCGLALAQLAGVLSAPQYSELLEASRLYVRAGGTAAQLAEDLEAGLALFGDVAVH